MLLSSVEMRPSKFIAKLCARVRNSLRLRFMGVSKYLLRTLFLHNSDACLGADYKAHRTSGRQPCHGGEDASILLRSRTRRTRQQPRSTGQLDRIATSSQMGRNVRLGGKIWYYNFERRCKSQISMEPEFTILEKGLCPSAESSTLAGFLGV